MIIIIILCWLVVLFELKSIPQMEKDDKEAIVKKAKNAKKLTKFLIIILIPLTIVVFIHTANKIKDHYYKINVIAPIYQQNLVNELPNVVPEVRRVNVENNKVTLYIDSFYWNNLSSGMKGKLKVILFNTVQRVGIYSEYIKSNDSIDLFLYTTNHDFIDYISR